MMNYVYDILLNFHFTYFDFYDWNVEDKFSHIRRIPIFKISSKKLKDIIYNDVKFNSDFLFKIKNLTEVFKKNDVHNILYSCLLCDERKVVGIKCDIDGNVTGRSDLLIDEQCDVMSVVDRYKEYDIDYHIIKKNEVDFFKTRKDILLSMYLINEIKKQSTERLMYLMYEYDKNYCYKDRDELIKKLTEIVKKNDFEKINRFIQLINKQKSV